jgi:hypothetical protein
MNARLERIGAHVERIDALVCRMERGGAYRALPTGNAPGLFPVALRVRALHLLDLPADVLAVIATQLAQDDELAAALACRRLRQALAGTERRVAGAWLSTTIGSAFCSVGKLEWAVLYGRLPFSGRLLLHAARGGQLEQLSWLRAHGCAWEPCDGDGEDCCSSAAGEGHLAVLSGRARPASHGVSGRLCTQRRVGTCLCCSGCMPMAARGMRRRALLQLRVGTWLCCNGWAACIVAVRGMRTPAGVLLASGIVGKQSVQQWGQWGPMRGLPVMKRTLSVYTEVHAA